MKKCYYCKIEKEYSEFYKNKNGRYGLDNRCKNCEKNRSKSRNYRVEKYGISNEDFLSMKEVQNYKCLICNQIKPLIIDHCHKTRKVRGLLCTRCNIKIGFLQDNPEIVKAAILYIERNNAN